MIPPPTYQYDFTKLQKVNGITYVLDQVSQDPSYSFGMFAADYGLCDAATKTVQSPTLQSDGLNFNQANIGLRSYSADRINFKPSFTIAIWFKLYYTWDVGSRNNEFIYSIRDKAGINHNDLTIRVTSKSINGNNYLVPQFALTDIGWFTTMSLALSYTWNFYYVSIAASDQQPGPYKVKFSQGMMSSYGVTSQYWESDFNNWGILDTLKQQYVFIGAYCDMSSGQNQYVNSFLGTLGKIYHWNDYFVDQGTQTQFLSYPSGYVKQAYCASSVLMPCNNCLYDPLKSNFYCSSSNYISPLVAFWNFDADYSQYIIDQTGNGHHLYNMALNDQESGEAMRVIGQGYLIGSGSKLTATKVPKFGNDFTIEFWFRQNPEDAVANSELVFYQLTTLTGSSCKSYLSIKAEPGSALVIDPDCQSQFNWGPSPYIKNNGIWSFFSISIKRYLDTRYRAAPQTNINAVIDGISYYLQTDELFPIPDDSKHLFQIYTKAGSGTAYTSFYLYQMKMYSFAKSYDEVMPMQLWNNALLLITNCASNGITTCNSCPIETGICISKCKQATYGPKCLPCSNKCGHCSGTADNCLYCSRNVSSNFLYSQTFGNCTCADGFYYDSTSDACKPCHANCKTCFGPDYTQCMQCVASKFFFPSTACVAACDDTIIKAQAAGSSYYADSSPVGFKLCAKCHPYCTLCTGGQNTQCSACATGYFLQGTTCTNTCPDGKWADFTNSVCANCDTSCSICSAGDNKSCQKCSNALYVVQNGQCQSQCDNGFYADSGTCYPCNAACAFCTTPDTTHCSDCNTGWFLEYHGFKCLKSCSAGQYGDATANKCQLCHYSCLTCTSGLPQDCTQCTPGFYRDGSLCVAACRIDQFIVGDTCQSCDSKCSTCYGTLDTQCYSCNQNQYGLGYFFFNNTCLVNCPDGYYADATDNSCKKCPSKCATCSSATFCTSCIKGPYQLNSGECTYFQCLSTQYRATSPSLQCYNCHPTCLTCSGGSQFDCLSCIPLYKYYQQQCLTCDQQPGMKTPIIEGQTTCQEICGDGFNYKQYQCDDGNQANGDGCSSKCIVEQGWNCTGGSTKTQDTCIYTLNTIPQIALVNSLNQVFIAFSEEVKLTGDTLDSKSLLVTVTGPQSSYDFTWHLDSQYQTTSPIQTLMIHLVFYSSLKGGQQEKVTIQFTNPQIYINNVGNGVVTIPISDYLSAYQYIDPATAAALDSAGTNSMVATLGAVGLNLAVSLIFGGSISAMWTMVNTIQLISLLPLMDIAYPRITIIVFEKMLSSLGESTFIPNVFYTYGLNRKGSALLEEPALNQRFSDYGWTVSNFLSLSGRKILIWTALIVAYPFVYYMKKNYADKHKMCTPWIGIDQKYKYTLLLRGVLVSYVSMFLAATLNIFKMNFSTLENVISVFIAITFMIILIYLPIQLMNILMRNYQIITTPKFMASYSTIIKELNLNHPLKYMYYPVFLLRRAVFAICLVLFANSPKVQIGVMAFTALVMIVYVAVIRPQKQLMMVVLTAAGEVMLLLLHLISIAFLNPDLSEATSNKIGWLIVVLVGLYILINWVIIMAYTIVDLIKQYKNWKIKKIEKKLQRLKDKEYKKWKKKNQLEKRNLIEEEKAHIIEAFKAKEIQYLKQKQQEQFNGPVNGSAGTSNNLQVYPNDYREDQFRDSSNMPYTYNEETGAIHNMSESPNPFYNPALFVNSAVSNQNNEINTEGNVLGSNEVEPNLNYQPYKSLQQSSNQVTPRNENNDSGFMNDQLRLKRKKQASDD